MANVLVNTLRYHASVSQPVVNVFVHTMNRFDGCGHQFSFAIGYTACRLMCCDRLQLITYSTTFYSTTYYPTIVSSVSHCVMSFPLVFLVFSAPNSKNHAFFQCANMVTASYNSQVSTHITKSCPLWEFIMKLCWVISFFFFQIRPCFIDGISFPLRIFGILCWWCELRRCRFLRMHGYYICVCLHVCVLASIFKPKRPWLYTLVGII